MFMAWLYKTLTWLVLGAVIFGGVFIWHKWNYVHYTECRASVPTGVSKKIAEEVPLPLDTITKFIPFFF